MIVRLEIPDDAPKFHSELMQQCCGNESRKTPNCILDEKSREWINLICHGPHSEISNKHCCC